MTSRCRTMPTPSSRTTPVLMTDGRRRAAAHGKELRRGEEAAMGAMLARLDVPVVYELHGEARAEGGDLLWLDHDTLYAGLGFRTNAEGVRQLGEALAPLGVDVRAVDLPYFTGPEACLHLLSLISMVDDDLAVVCEPQLPVALWQALRGRDITLVRVPEREFPEDDGDQRAGPGSAAVSHAPGQSRDTARAHGGRRHGADLSRQRALAQGRGRPHLPDAAHSASVSARSRP